jgi:hypothetical protein
MNDIGVPDLKVMFAYAKVGIQMLASRILSLTALFGVVALAGYVTYNPSWQGASVVAVIALFVFVPALKAESTRRSGDEHDQP